MTGMKEGAGENPFAEDPDPTASETEKETNATDTETSTETETESTMSSSSESQQSQRQSMQIPYKFRRDGVQDGRDRVPLFLQPETKRAERDALRELEKRFDDDVSLTDLREGLMMVGLDHLDEVEEQLEEWGHGMTFDT
ncbi:hypothetical protein CV102_23725 [Natronococcus pandeyae]|uniref:Uncharacterized protein n=1 Tax=Natronococcus pandeyae TaxID=2055836 RepID=A0A8J8TNC5_9EURY|nr:hypothetical protein [Natronococcus pandeyae]TYL36158.1 hypothetical protein CV102_23725 [Natronococcus pandeyae]